VSRRALRALLLNLHTVMAAAATLTGSLTTVDQQPQQLYRLEYSKQGFSSLYLPVVRLSVL
jgi:hypothetical protein